MTIQEAFGGETIMYIAQQCSRKISEKLSI